MPTQQISERRLKQAPAKKIMIVEDESIISLDIKSSLMRLGYDVAGIAASGDSALKKIQNSRPDLILMDIHLKGEMTGIDVSSRVKSDFQIPIVYLTANADSSTFKAANQTDPYGYLLKPFQEKELEIAIEIALHKHEKEQSVRSSEHWYATAFQSLSEGVVATDLHGDVVFMNAYAESILGWTLVEAIDLPVTDVLKFYRKIRQFDSIELKESVSSILGATLRGTDVVSLPHDAQLSTRSSKAIAVTGNAVAIRDTAGYVVGSLFTFRVEVEAPAANTNNRAKAIPPLASSELSASSAIATHQQPISQKETSCLTSFIEAFINEQPAYFTGDRLVANITKNQATLTSRTEGTIITGKLVRDQLTAIVSRDSKYWDMVCHILIENSFFPVSQRTNGTCYFQHCTIPKDCQAYRTKAMELWEVWHGKPCPNQEHSTAKDAKVSRANLVVLRRGKWYHIQAISLSQDILKIKTIAGELFTSTEDLLVWGAQLRH